VGFIISTSKTIQKKGETLSEVQASLQVKETVNQIELRVLDLAIVHGYPKPVIDKFRDACEVVLTMKQPDKPVKCFK
jgi:hypothetical protein